MKQASTSVYEDTTLRARQGEAPARLPLFLARAGSAAAAAAPVDAVPLLCCGPLSVICWAALKSIESLPVGLKADHRVKEISKVYQRLAGGTARQGHLQAGRCRSCECRYAWGRLCLRKGHTVLRDPRRAQARCLHSLQQRLESAVSSGPCHARYHARNPRLGSVTLQRTPRLLTWCFLAHVHHSVDWRLLSRQVGLSFRIFRVFHS